MRKRKWSEQGNRGAAFCWHTLLFEPGRLRFRRILLIHFVVLHGKRRRPDQDLYIRLHHQVMTRTCRARKLNQLADSASFGEISASGGGGRVRDELSGLANG